MKKMIEIQVQNQCNQILSVQAALHECPKDSKAEQRSLNQRIAHIVVDGEVILPSIELLYASRHSPNIYQVVV